MRSFPEPKRDGVAVGASNSSARASLTTLHNPILLYQFDNDMADDGSAAEDLSVGAGSANYEASYMTTQRSFRFNGATHLAAAGNAAYRLTGDMALQAILRLRMIPGQVAAIQNICICGASGETEAANALWSMYVSAAGELQYVAEKDAGSNIVFTNSGHVVPFGEFFHLAMVRSSSQIQFYVNGYPFGSPSSGLDAPTGGTSTVLTVGENPGESVYLNGDLACLKLIGSALSASEVLAEAQRCGLPA